MSSQSSGSGSLTPPPNQSGRLPKPAGGSSGRIEAPPKGVRSGQVAVDALTPERRQFQMKSCLGRGGFGEVYRATMTSSGGVRTEVAVKVLHAEVDPNSQAVQRLRDEGRMLGAVRHPSVLRVYDLVVLDGRVALVTEYVEGQDYDKLIVSPPGGAPRTTDPLPARAVLEVIARVAEALDAAYNAPMPGAEGNKLHLIHRDVKPANIRVGRHGEVKLLDFGIAHAATPDREARTETNAVLGSYLYMAPERFLDNVETGPAVDVYALGLTLYEGLTGARLFGDLSLKEMYLLILDDGKYLTYLRKALERVPSEIPHQVVALLQRILDLDPTKRPDHQTLAKTCYELADRLPGKTLDRWARARQWPPPRSVRGMLDGTIITESSFSHSGTVEPVERVELPPHRTGTHTGSLTASFVRTATATLEKPGVVVGVSVGLFGLAGVIALMMGLAIIGGVALWQATRPHEEGLKPIEIPAPAPVVVIEQPAPPTPTAPVETAPHPAHPHPVAPVPEAVPPDPVPVPAPPPPRPVPAPDVQNVTVKVDSDGVLVRFVDKNGQPTMARSLLPGMAYEIQARFENTWQTQEDKLYVNPGDQVTVKCSNLKAKCWVDK